MQPGDGPGQSAAQQRFAAGQPYLGDAEALYGGEERSGHGAAYFLCPAAVSHFSPADHFRGLATTFGGCRDEVKEAFAMT